MTNKTASLRPWTATEIHKFRGLAKRKVGVPIIARVLKRSSDAIAQKARLLRVPLEQQG
jgi:hypothetical protein